MKHTYRIVAYIPVIPEPEDDKLYTYSEALKEREELEAMQPENIYRIEWVDEV